MQESLRKAKKVCGGGGVVGWCIRPFIWSGYIDHGDCTDHKVCEGHNGYTVLLDNLNLSKRPVIPTFKIISTLLLVME